MLVTKFIETELNAYIKEHGLTESPFMVKLLVKAFEAYEEYKRLVSVSAPEDEDNFYIADIPFRKGHE